MQHYISVCGLSLAWVTSENSTKQLECRHLLTQSSSLDPILSATGLRSPVLTAPVRASTPTLLSVPPLCSLVANSSQLLCPANSHLRPLTTSGYGEISGPRILCLVSRQNRQRNRLLWRETHIVLQSYPSAEKQLVYSTAPAGWAIYILYISNRMWYKVCLLVELSLSEFGIFFLLKG